MILNFSIDDSSDEAQALLKYLRSFDFVNVENETYQLTDRQVEVLEERRKNYLSEKSASYTLDEVLDSLGTKK